MRKTAYFAVITDQHIVEPGANLYGLDTKRSTEALIESLRSEPTPLEGIICLGDLADTVINPNRMTAVAGPEAYAHARELLGSVSARFLSLPGNHDEPSVMSEFFPSAWERVEHGVSYSNFQGFTFIGLDVRTGPEPTGMAKPESLEVLQRVLSGSSRAVVFSHYPLFDLDNQRIDAELSTINRAEIQAVLQRHTSKIAACFHGHLHIWIAGLRNGILTHSVPSSSFTFILEPQGTILETVGNQPCGYLLLGLQEDGSIIVRPRFLPPAQRV